MGTFREAEQENKQRKPRGVRDHWPLITVEITVDDAKRTSSRVAGEGDRKDMAIVSSRIKGDKLEVICKDKQYFKIARC